MLVGFAAKLLAETAANAANAATLMSFITITSMFHYGPGGSMRLTGPAILPPELVKIVLPRCNYFEKICNEVVVDFLGKLLTI